LRLADLQLGGVVHGKVLNRGEGCASIFCGVDANVAHVADVEKTYGISNGFVFRDQSPEGRILDGHIPASEIDHFCTQTAVDPIEGCFTGARVGRRDGRFHYYLGQKEMVTR